MPALLSPAADRAAPGQQGDAVQPLIHTVQPLIHPDGSRPNRQGCSESVSNPDPRQGQTTEEAQVVTAARAHARLEADYVHTRSVHGVTARSDGAISYFLPIAHAPPGVVVELSILSTLRGVRSSCTTTFIPAEVTKMLKVTLRGPRPRTFEVRIAKLPRHKSTYKSASSVAPPTSKAHGVHTTTTTVPPTTTTTTVPPPTTTAVPAAPLSAGTASS
jgi:hypothetical protein